MTDAAAAALGRRDARVITSFREPFICAPLILVLQCERDLDAFAGASMDRDLKLPNAGPAPFRALRTAIAEGDLGHASRALGYINAQAYPTLPARQQAMAAAAQAAGLIRSAGPSRLLRTLSAGPVITPALAPQLTQLGLTPPNAAAMLSPSGDAATSAFLRAVDAAFPPGALITLPPLDGRHDEGRARNRHEHAGRVHRASGSRSIP